MIRFLHLILLPVLFSPNILQAQSMVAQTRSPKLRFSVYDNGSYELFDERAQISWRASAPAIAFGRVTLIWEGKPRQVELTGAKFNFGAQEGLATFHPLAEKPEAELRVRIRALSGDATLAVSYDADEVLKIDSISLLDGLTAVTDSGKGYVLVPVREGLLIPADSGLAFEQRFDTYAYEGCHMEMLGIVQQGAALLITWDDPYVAAVVKSVTNGLPGSCSQRLTASLTLRKSAHSFQLHVLGKGDYLQIAQAYRKIAAGRGWVVPWTEKLKSHPERAKLFGAANIKLWSTLDRRMNEESTREESVRVNWTFGEAAQVAEHLKQDLKLDKVLFTIGGWIHRGYDNQHPDILPTAPECGGDAAFADCARRVMQLGYLFCLHDNYQDIYRDSPSWDERYVMKTPEGKLSRGGHWAGGLAYLTCSRMALELAQRPQNLAAVKKLCGANCYFIDTTYAAGLQECFDPDHPLTRGDDMRWKQALSDYGRKVFGVFGSECGREWAIPHSDFFEGLTGVSGTYYHDTALPGRVGGTVIPLFEMVYRDCIAMYGKYGYDPSRAAEYVLQHISLGRPLNYHSIPPHLYWQRGSPEDQELALRPAIASLKANAAGKLDIIYQWDVERPATNDWRVFVHFTDRSGNIKFQGDYQPAEPVSSWGPGQHRQGPFSVTIPEGLTGTFNVRMGLFNPDQGQRALLSGRDNGERSYLVGRLTLSSEKAEFQAAESASRAAGLSPFVRAEGGWAEHLHPADRFIKNTCEILSPLNELTAQLPLTGHEFLTPDKKVIKTVFGGGAKAVQVVVNSGSGPYTLESRSHGPVELPQFGFVVEGPTFAAFHALKWNGVNYQAPAMFTLRSLDSRPLARSRALRVYHAFGPERIRVAREETSVHREEVLKAR